MAGIELYRSPDGGISFDVKTDGQEAWLPQAQMAELFGRDATVIGRHLTNAHREELASEATRADHAVVRSEGGRDVERVIAHYDVDAVLSVGYRVKSLERVAFRRWANDVLRRTLPVTRDRPRAAHG